MHEPARLATTAVSLPPASERLNMANSETAPIVLGSSDVGARVAAPFIEIQHCRAALVLVVLVWLLALGYPHTLA
jgi:hypothetical protein